MLLNNLIISFECKTYILNHVDTRLTFGTIKRMLSEIHKLNKKIIVEYTNVIYGTSTIDNDEKTLEDYRIQQDSTIRINVSIAKQGGLDNLELI